MLTKGLSLDQVRPRKRRAEDDAFVLGTGRSPVSQFARLASYSGMPEGQADDAYVRPARNGQTFRSSISPPRTWQPSNAPVETPSPFGPVSWTLIVDGCQGERSLPFGPNLRCMAPTGLNRFFLAAFVSRFHQLGFLHRPTFLHELQTRTGAHSPFLLLAMLSVSARLTPSLLSYFGSIPEATNFFLSRTHAYLADGLAAPTLERVQALYILSLAESAEGNSFRAQMILDLARSMASTLGLNKAWSSEDEVSASCIEQEVRRRTWWCLQVEQGYEASPPARLSVVSGLGAVPLPMDEQEFAFGTTTKEPVTIPAPAAAVETIVATQTSLLGLLLLSRKLLQDASLLLQELERTKIEVLDRIALRLEALEKSFSPLQMATTSNFLAYRSQSLDIGFNEIHLNLGVTSLLVTDARTRMNQGSDGEGAEALSGFARAVFEKVDQLLISQPQPVLPPIL